MVSPATANFPVPNSEDEFEDMALDALRLRYGRHHLIRLGRRGQTQGGIDGFDQEDPSLVWQATLQAKGILPKIEVDLGLMDETYGDLNPEVFVAALGAPRDAKLQRELMKLSAARMLAEKCRVDVLFWEDIRHILVGDPALMAKHFVGFGVGESELARLQAEREKLERRPAIYVRWTSGSVEGEKLERKKFEVRNVGGCAFEIVKVGLKWWIEGDHRARYAPATLEAQMLTQNETTRGQVTLLFSDAATACVEAGLVRPKIIQEAPILGRLEIEAVSQPYEVAGAQDVRFERAVNRVPPGMTAAAAVRRKLLQDAYKGLMQGSIHAWVFWKYPSTSQDELNALARESKWLEDHGLLETSNAIDNTIVKVRLTTAGRDYVEAPEFAALLGE